MSLSNSDNICHPSWAECPNFNGESPENPPEYRGLLSNDNPGFSGVYETSFRNSAHPSPELEGAIEILLEHPWTPERSIQLDKLLAYAELEGGL